MLQLQFTILGIYGGVPLFLSTCPLPKWTSFIAIPQGAFFIYMFSKFYINAYKVEKSNNNEKRNKASIENKSK